MSASQTGDPTLTVTSPSSWMAYDSVCSKPGPTSRTGLDHLALSTRVALVATTQRSGPAGFSASVASAAPAQPTPSAFPTDSSSVVDERIRQHVPLVGILVSERLRTVPSHVTRDDLMSAGLTALVLSARAFDPTLGVPFPVFASFRIRGALLDELRSMDWTSRAVRSRVRDIDLVTAELSTTLARQPRTDEIAVALGLSIKEVERTPSDVARGPVLSLHSFAADCLPALAGEGALGPESLILQRERLGYLHDAVASLPDRLRFVVVAYYFEQRQMADIAVELSVTQSRVSQMCAEALALIRDGMNSQLDPEALAPLASTGRAAASRRAYYRAIADRNTILGRLAMSDSWGDMRPIPAVDHADHLQDALAG